MSHSTITNCANHFLALLFFFAIGIQGFTQQSDPQKLYTNSGGEMIFQFNNTESDGEPINSPMRWTIFVHLGQYVHYDFSNSIGMYTGLAMRNVGMITDERIDDKDYKFIRRVYSLGIPLALKLGSFDNHFHIFAGGEIEMAFHYKQKYWDSHTRGGSKTNSNQWFGGQTERFLPSVFGGIQFPGGVNLKAKWYLDNFLNNSYKDDDIMKDLTRYNKTELFYVSLSWVFYRGWYDDMIDRAIPEAGPRAFVDF